MKNAMRMSSIMNLGVPYILCKAHDDTYREILVKLGADRVIIPEREIADRLAMGLTTSGVMEYIELSKEYGIVEMNPPAAWVGKTIRSLEVRTRYGANIIAVDYDPGASEVNQLNRIKLMLATAQRNL